MGEIANHIYTTRLVHITEIRAGDTVEHCSELLTVCRSNLKRDPFYGLTLFGDSYRCGRLLVKKADVFSARRNAQGEPV